MRKILFIIVTFTLLNCRAVACIIPSVSVSIAESEGKAKLAEAESSRRIAVLEAQAKLDSAELLARAEILRAEGTSKANKILGESLKGNEAYLRYLWIDKISEQPNIIYIPTEAGIPILEAGKNNHK